EGAKASVMLRVKQGKELSSERTDAIVSLIASSVEGLDPSNVSLLDTRGRLLVAAGRGKSNGLNDAGAFHAQLEAKQKFETENAARIIALLEPVVGLDRVRADVAADIDFSQIEQSEEKYNPQSQVVRSQQTSNEARNSNSANPNGIVGARSNNPTTLASPSPIPSPATQPNGDSRNTSTVNYEIDKTVKKTVGGGGRVNRMTVSVVVDHKTVNGVEVARTPDEIKQIQDLVGGAIGIDTNRGDSVVVQTMPFEKPVDVAATTSTLDKYKQFVPSAFKYGALILIAVMLLLFVILPARKALKIAVVHDTEAQKLLAAANKEGEKRANDAGTPKQIEEKTLKGIPPLKTVAELAAKMDADEELISVNNDSKRLEAIKKQIAEQSLTDTETVVSTLRGWLRESN
ncbi:MAG: flagellar basal-body MS-ring/collar protein FliF, partial [Actinomycetota bacterium]